MTPGYIVLTTVLLLFFVGPNLIYSWLIGFIGTYRIRAQSPPHNFEGRMSIGMCKEAECNCRKLEAQMAMLSVHMVSFCQLDQSRKSPKLNTQKYTHISTASKPVCWKVSPWNKSLGGKLLLRDNKNLGHEFHCLWWWQLCCTICSARKLFWKQLF